MSNHRTLARQLNQLLRMNPRAEKLKRDVRKAQALISSGVPQLMAKGTEELMIAKIKQGVLKGLQDALIASMQSTANTLPQQFSNSMDDQLQMISGHSFLITNELRRETRMDIAPSYKVNRPSQAFYRELRVQYASDSWNNFYQSNGRSFPRPNIFAQCAGRFTGDQEWDAVLTKARL